jgi:hypothetical protein
VSQVRHAARQRIPAHGIRLTVDKSQLPKHVEKGSGTPDAPWQRDSLFRLHVKGKNLQVDWPRHGNLVFVWGRFCLGMWIRDIVIRAS